MNEVHSLLEFKHVPKRFENLKEPLCRNHFPSPGNIHTHKCPQGCRQPERQPENTKELSHPGVDPKLKAPRCFIAVSLHTPI